jgi:hypothetical protein
MRTTLDIADPVLRQLKKLQRVTGKSMGQLASELLAQAMATPASKRSGVVFQWTSQPMGALIDLSDKDALHRALDEQP